MSNKKQLVQVLVQFEVEVPATDEEGTNAAVGAVLKELAGGGYNPVAPPTVLPYPYGAGEGPTL